MKLQDHYKIFVFLNIRSGSNQNVRDCCVDYYFDGNINGTHSTRRVFMALWRPDPTFYPSPKLAMQAPPERVAFVAMLNGNGNAKPDALGVVDVDPASSGYGRIVGQVDM